MRWALAVSQQTAPRANKYIWIPHPFVHIRSWNTYITSLQKLKWGSFDYWHLLPCFPHTVTIAVKMWEVQGGVRGRNGERKGGNDHDWNLKNYLTNRKRCWKWKINPQSRWSCMINSPLQFSTIAFFLLYSLLLPGLFYWQHPPCYVSYSCPVPPASLLF